VTVNEKFENGVGANLFNVLFNFKTTPIPIQDDLQVKFITSLAPTNGGTTPSPFKVQEYTDIEIYYDDPNAGTDISNSFITTNSLFPNSSVLLELGDVFLGDRDGNVPLQAYFLPQNIPTKQWAIDAVGGGGIPINLLLTQELVHQRKTPRRKFDLNIYGAYLPISAVIFDNTRFILNGGRFNARDESFEATLIEIKRQDGDIVSDEQNGQGNAGNPTFKVGAGNQSGINDRMRWAGNYGDLSQGVTLSPNDLTLESGWLAVANVSTTDSPAPVTEGDPFRLIAENYAPTSTGSNSVITSGHTYTFTNQAFVSEVLVYPTTVATNWSYRVFIKDLLSGSETILDGLTLAGGQWNTVQIGNNVFAAGTELLIYLETTNSGGSATFAEQFNFWPTYPPPSGISVLPYLEFNGVAQTPESATAMGVDIQLQDVTFSPDFTILSYSDFFSTGGGGAGAVESVNGQTGVVSLGTADLNNVTTAAPSDGDIIVYRTASGQYVLEQKPAAGTNPAWGDITGTLSSQTDLQTALDLKVNAGDLATVATSGSYNDLTNKPTTITAQQASDILDNNAKVGITAQQAADITTNNAKISYTDAAQVATNTSNISTIQGEQTVQDGLIATNTAKVGITPTQAADITANNAKISYTDAAAVALNTAKRSYPIGDENKLAGIAAGAEVNVNADWNATSGDAEILNKPTIPPTAPVDSVNGKTGVVVLTSDDIDDSADAHKFVTAAQRTQIGTNQTNIATNVINIDSNTTRITEAETAIEDNSTAINVNAGNISTNTGAIITNAGNIATNSADILKRLQWVGEYYEAISGGKTNFSLNDVTRQDGWLATANKLTTDRPAPELVGLPYYLIGGQWRPQGAANTSVVESGHEYKINNGKFLTQISVYPAIVVATYSYRARIAIIEASGDTFYQDIPLTNLVSQEWSVIRIGNALIKADTTIKIVLETISSQSSTNINDGWNYAGRSNSPTITQNDFYRSNNNATLFLSQYGFNIGDLFTQLSGIISGSTIKVSQTTDLANFVEWEILGSPTYSGTGAGDVNGSYTFDGVVVLSEGGNALSGSGYAVTIDINIPVPSPTNYIFDPDYWSQFPPPSDVIVTPLLSFNGVAQSVNESTAFGVDIQLQDANISEDWDFMAYSPELDGAEDAVQAQQSAVVSVAENPFTYYISDNVASAKIREEIFTLMPLTSVFSYDSNYNLVSNPNIAEDAFFIRSGNDIILKDL
jgi:hypothetical protein